MSVESPNAHAYARSLHMHMLTYKQLPHSSVCMHTPSRTKSDVYFYEERDARPRTKQSQGIRSLLRQAFPRANSYTRRHNLTYTMYFPTSPSLYFLLLSLSLSLPLLLWHTHTLSLISLTHLHAYTSCDRLNLRLLVEACWANICTLAHLDMFQLPLSSDADESFFTEQ